jgi:hypothetical protein
VNFTTNAIDTHDVMPILIYIYNTDVYSFGGQSKTRGEIFQVFLGTKSGRHNGIAFWNSCRTTLVVVAAAAAGMSVVTSSSVGRSKCAHILSDKVERRDS